jgi:hypothetical protein
MVEATGQTLMIAPKNIDAWSAPVTDERGHVHEDVATWPAVSYIMVCQALVFFLFKGQIQSQVGQSHVAMYKYMGSRQGFW